MRKVVLNLKEVYQCKIIKKLVETNGNKKRAAIKLNCIPRHIHCLIRKNLDESKEVTSPQDMKFFQYEAIY